jgi:hypothetical protein
MTAPYLRPIAFAALALAGAAMAQNVPPAPPPNSGPPPADPMNPYAVPSGMEAGDRAIEPSAADRINTGVRDAAADRTASRARGTAAAAADITPGSEVRDSKGKVVGTVEAVETDGAVVATAAGRVKVPLDAFGKNRKGLMLGITKAEFDAAVANATSAPTG